MSSEPAIRVEQLSKCYQIYDTPQDRLKQALWRGRRRFYREFWALRELSFDVAKGETLGVIGRNGSGKSTLLQMICGTLSPTTGTISVNGRVAALLELGAGFNPEFSGRENVRLNAALLGLTSEQIESRMDSILAFADIGEFVDQPVKTFSSGMFVRLAFAVVAHVDADILIIDEALAVGDAFFTQKCMRFLRRFSQEGTLLFVSHDTSAVINLCQRAIWLDGGRLQQLGAAKECCEAYLASLHAQQRRELGVGAVESTDAPVVPKRATPALRKDARLKYVNASQLRNDIEIFDFDADASAFGAGGVRVLGVELRDLADEPLAWTVGGDDVRLAIEILALVDIDRPIVGFYVKDRLGQRLFGDNTYLAYAERPLYVAKGKRFAAVFEFAMPILPPGEYAVDVAVAEGTQAEHVQHQWAHDVLVFRAHTAMVASGLVGIPMLGIRLEPLD
jgi:lipopolysaccharide transport system ATP-binding protein